MFRCWIFEKYIFVALRRKLWHVLWKHIQKFPYHEKNWQLNNIFFFLVYHISEVSHTPFPHHLPNSHNRNYTIQYDISFSCEYYSPTIQSLKSFSFYKTIHFEPYTCLTTSFPILLQSHVTRYQIYSHLTSINASPYLFVYTINIYILTQKWY